MKFYIAHEPMTSGLIQYNQSELSFDTVGNEERLFTIVLYTYIYYLMSVRIVKQYAQ